MKPMPGLNEILLYLDYDGCLHNRYCLYGFYDGTTFREPEGYELFQYIDLLEELLLPYPQVKIILCTKWLLFFKKADTIKALSPNLRHRVIGTILHRGTNSKKICGKTIGQLAEQDIKKRKPKDWFAICDSIEGWSTTFARKVIFTHYELGISEPKAKRLIRERLELLCKVEQSPAATPSQNSDVNQTSVARSQLRHYRDSLVVVDLLRKFVAAKDKEKDESEPNNHLLRAVEIIKRGDLQPEEILWCVDQLSKKNRLGRSVR
ncbi:HAD domain-containing protein [Rhodoferax mekongensis]|uniref:HAD domain-containing protein n=1 Tax=Rhodoferax mekongensis TaxID=3068341 RepID=A0ABZ0AWT3_9BURK|nr:HAD domain-containing protein [Rhodoferax sp. TBRC 17307]WNO03954.1 HAD domain-containing protein [Rhodoferax sp. TBRC 17307]